MNLPQVSVWQPCQGPKDMLTPLPTWSSRASQSVLLAKETLEGWIRAGGVKESETNVTSCRKASWFAQPESGLRDTLSKELCAFLS